MAREVLVLGANGFLGSNLTLRASRMADTSVTAQSRSGGLGALGVHEVVADVGDPAVVAELIRRIEPDVVVNCVALADVDRCEREPHEAQRINAALPAVMAESTQSVGATFVHISTDAVFGGSEGPYGPLTSPSPVNEYGRSKLEGEERVLDANPAAIVARTNIVGWSPSGVRSLLEFFVNGLAEGGRVRGFDDVYFRPMSAYRLWDGLEVLLSSSCRGVHHLVGLELLSKYDFGCRVAEIFGNSLEQVERAVVADAGLEARRGANLDLEPDPQVVRSSSSALEISSALVDLATAVGDRALIRSLGGST